RFLSLKPRVGERLGVVADPYRGAVVCLYAEVLPGEGMPDPEPYLVEPVPLGGEGRYVRVEPVPPCGWPPADPGRPRSLWYLATPAFLDADPARPPLREGLKLRAAASGAGTA